MKTNTVKYEVGIAAFGQVIKSPVYVTQEALREAFGNLPEKIRITIEEAQ